MVLLSTKRVLLQPDLSPVNMDGAKPVIEE